MTFLLSEKIVNAVGTGEDPDELDALEAQSATLAGLTASAAELNILDGATFTTSEVNAAVSGSRGIVKITDAASYAVLAANSGKTHIFPNLTSSCTATLPTAAAGLEFTFQYGVEGDGGRKGASLD